VYRAAADFVVLLHFAFIVFAALGGLLVLRWRWAPWVHVPAVAWGAFIELSGGICPLTPLENALRATAGEPTYSGDFVARYLLPVIYPQGLTPSIQAAIGVALVALNGAIYLLVWRRRRHRRGLAG
jgi:hypothetical protein